MKNLQWLLLALIRAFSIIILVQAQNPIQPAGIISLDCGLPAHEPPYDEPSTGVRYTSDAEYAQSGKTGRISKKIKLDFTKPFTTLRYFPEGERNCYDLNVTRGINYLIRTKFVYGNYDGLNKTPEFDLYLGPNLWKTIDLKKLFQPIWIEEVIHVARSSSLQVCLVKTGTTTPLISTLELRPLGNDIYTTQSGSLKTLYRVYASNSSIQIRSPDDVYGRVWFSVFDEKWTQLTSTRDIVKSNNYDVPREILANAATPRNASSELNAVWRLVKPDDQFYFYVHFYEVQALRSNDIREFDIFLNGKSYKEALSPPGSQAYTLFSALPQRCDGGNCTLLLKKTPRSTLPPLFNSIEVYTLIQFPNPETDQNDVSAMKNIKETYRLSKTTWQGDPCVPPRFRWEDLTCNHSDISVPPRIASLNLSSNGLTGMIAPSLQNLNQLKVLDLSGNSLTGEVPEFLATMKSLTVLNLSKNNLLDRKAEGLKLIIERNPELCDSRSCDPRTRNAVLTLFITTVSSIACIATACVIYFIIQKRKESTVKAQNGVLSESSILTRNRRFTYSEVLIMTNNFQKVLGKGGFGAVYLGVLDDTETVAVKVLCETSTQGYKEFKAEVELLLRVHHVNLVSLVGYCNEGDRLALIYEYMPNGDLKEFLSGRRNGLVLSWESRLRIAAEAALGLEYLHVGCKPPMIHSDVKCTNILLDEDFHAKLADFGFSRSFPVGDETHESISIAGTPGYLDPEYYRKRSLDEKSDVYSFGIVVLEIITNQAVIDHARERIHIAEWVKHKLTKGDIKDVMDLNLGEDYDSGSALRFIELAFMCVNHCSTNRPNMSWVVQELKECLKSESSRTTGRRDMESKSSIDISTDESTHF